MMTLEEKIMALRELGTWYHNLAVDALDEKEYIYNTARSESYNDAAKIIEGE